MALVSVMTVDGAVLAKLGGMVLISSGRKETSCGVGRSNCLLELSLQVVVPLS